MNPARDFGVSRRGLEAETAPVRTWILEPLSPFLKLKSAYSEQPEAALSPLNLTPGPI
jgi:hypothetical protein